MTNAEPRRTAKSVSVQLWEQDGMWEWDIRWPGPPKTRSTGCSPTLRETLEAVSEDILAITGGER